MRQLQDLNEAQLGTLMVGCAKAIEDTFDNLLMEQARFALVIFNDPKLGQYISNCDRKAMVEALRECADRMEKGEDVTRIYRKPQ
jgi:hypothetical protein